MPILVAVARDVVEEQVDPLESATVFCLPPQVVFPSRLIPDEEHRSVLDEVVLLAAASLKVVDGVEKSAGVGGGAHEVGGLAQGLVVGE